MFCLDLELSLFSLSLSLFVEVPAKVAYAFLAFEPLLSYSLFIPPEEYGVPNLSIILPNAIAACSGSVNCKNFSYENPA